MAYYGRLTERAHIREEILFRSGKGSWEEIEKELPPLDVESVTKDSELRDEDPIFEFVFIKEVKNSLIGQVREVLVDQAIEAGCDYVFFFDDDMLFAKETLIRLFRRQVPVVYALAFTSRQPVVPVVYKFITEWNPKTQRNERDTRFNLDYPRNSFFRADASGSGVCLIETDVFKSFPKPWFASTGCGEDMFFCYECDKRQIPIYVDSTLWTSHKPNFPMEWHDEGAFDRSLEKTNAQDSDRHVEALAHHIKEMV